MMNKMGFVRPGIALTASRLEAYAENHGVSINQTSVENEVAHLRNQNEPANEILLRIGPVFSSNLDVATEVPQTIPLALARLAVFDHGRPDESLDPLYGVQPNECAWFNVSGDPASEKIAEIADILDAHTEPDTWSSGYGDDGVEILEDYHYYMESDKYALKVTRQPLIRHGQIVLTSFAFALPERTEPTDI